MIGAWPFLVLGLLLLVLVILLLRRPIAWEPDSTDSSEQQQTQAALDAEAFPLQLVDRLFGSEDWEFVAKQDSPRVKRLFLQQRAALALSWLRAARASATRLIRAHSASARKNSRLEPLVELRVIVDYLVFQMLCQMIAAVIRFRGPVAMRRLVGYADRLSERLFEVVPGVFPARLASGNSKRTPARPRAPDQRGG